jgi:hypothetical protein
LKKNQNIDEWGVRRVVCGKRREACFAWLVPYMRGWDCFSGPSRVRNDNTLDRAGGLCEDPDGSNAVAQRKREIGRRSNPTGLVEIK